MGARQHTMLKVAGGLGALAVIVGAFGAHGLEARLSPELLGTYEVGVRYHFYHALALLVLCLGPETLWKSRAATIAAWSWVAGILLFSGSLYLLALTGTRWLGAITPLGGLAFIIGWAALLFSGRKEA